MTPAFASWQAFWAMGGYAFYVWLAAGVTLGAFLLLSAYIHWQKRQILRQIRQRQQREQRRLHARHNKEKRHESAS